MNRENEEMRLSSISDEGKWESWIVWLRVLASLMSKPTRYLVLFSKRTRRRLGAPFGFATYLSVIFKHRQTF